MMQIRDWPVLAMLIGVLALLVAGMVIGARCASGPDDGLPDVGNPIPGVGTIARPTPDSEIGRASCRERVSSPV